MVPEPSPISDKPTQHYRAFLVRFGFLILLVAWHGWMVLSLFGPWPIWERLLNDEPIVTGKHPANLYLGAITARALVATGSGCCYDPANDAGCPVTPIHSGSRLAQLFLLGGGAGFQPAAYKLGLVVSCLLAPFLLFIAGRGFGLTWGATLLGAAAALLVWWGQPEHDALHNGEVEVWLGGLALLAHAGLLVRFHRAPGLGCWLGMVLTASLVWFAQPLFLPIFLILGLTYYLTVGAKHPMLLWHLSLLASELAALAINSFWLRDWFTFWWLRAPWSGAPVILQHRTLRAFWEAPIWGSAEDRILALFLLASGLVGIWLLHRGRQRPSARLLGVGCGIMLVLAFAGVSCESLGEVGTFGLLVPAVWFAAFAAAHACTRTLRLMQFKFGSVATILCGLIMAAGGGALANPVLADLWSRYSMPQPMQIGLGAEQRSIVERLVLHTRPEGRILWENSSIDQSSWPALLSIMTGRGFVGALDPVCTIEHSAIGLVAEKLSGRPIEHWTDLELEDYCRLYNIGWIACWSAPVRERLEKWPAAKLLYHLSETSNNALFAVESNPLSYTLKGQAQVVHADCQHITLADVVPDDGVVVLSLHYQPGMRALPSRVQIEREPSALDAIGFIRLRVAGPVARVTLTWDDR